MSLREWQNQTVEKQYFLWMIVMYTHCHDCCYGERNLLKLSFCAHLPLGEVTVELASPLRADFPFLVYLVSELASKVSIIASYVLVKSVNTGV